MKVFKHSEYTISEALYHTIKFLEQGQGRWKSWSEMSHKSHSLYTLEWKNDSEDYYNTSYAI